MSEWEVFALRYAERNARTRGDSFIFDDHACAPHGMDYYLWLLRRGAEVILVDTGYDAAEGAARNRPILTDPREALAPFGLTAEHIQTVIVTHLHYDHAGGLHLFPNAHLHLQAAEMAYATGPCMCHDTLRMPFTGDHICEAVQRLYSGRLTFHDGDGQVAEGVTVHRVGGHSKGLQVVRVRTSVGWLCLASDATHYYENFLAAKPFPIVTDVAEMLDGFATIQSLASAPGLVVPGHDPIVRQVFPREHAEAWRLSSGLIGQVPSYD
ncbi:MBL fold hydrolase [Jannaschia pagri]|uniref:MBL fold hydrolase n=1 Tax=Jannaschia pagri TaxID=2829797 RepID=A0ABQ4NGF1_9RHOB|nr:MULTISPECIES: N-acyl homoserine lactonase family protein [unclassified Jannaschia]GIT90394.1 MBL fold hydrolase [Jannaschia sp. AI_61]GIT93501.1 MBL fold hydrolase [Jannaschia sp. AI_62]